MIGEIIVALVIGMPLALGLIFRTNTSYIFFSLMTGELLGRYFGHDLDGLIQQTTHSSEYEGYGEIFLIIAPVLLTSYILRGSIPKGKWIVHFIPLLVTGIIGGAFILPILPDDPLNLVRDVPIGDWMLHLNKTIIGGLLIVQLLSLWIINHIKHHREKKRSS